MVIAIIGILVALLLPAVQAARASARRIQCVNNLKQLGIAMLNFHDTHHQLPVGNVSCCWGTWQMMILPFLEEQALGDLYQILPPDEQFLLNEYRYDAKDPSHDPPITNRDVCEKRIATLTCPSDEPQVDSRGLTYHNYVVNYGNTNHIGWDHLGPGNPAYVKYLGGPFVGDDWNTHPDTQTKFREIKDGLSKTLLASETVQGQQGDLRGFTWWGWAAGFETLASPNASDPDTMQYAASLQSSSAQSAVHRAVHAGQLVQGRRPQSSRRWCQRGDAGRLGTLCHRLGRFGDLASGQYVPGRGDLSLQSVTGLPRRTLAGMTCATPPRNLPTADFPRVSTPRCVQSPSACRWDSEVTLYECAPCARRPSGGRCLRAAVDRGRNRAAD